MKELKTEKVLQFHEEFWLNLKPVLRYQSLAREVLGVPIDPLYGKVVSAKEGGGIRLEAVPMWAQYPGIVIRVQEVMEKAGWRIEVNALPRSTLCTALYAHEGFEVKVETPAMPSEDAILFGAMIAHKAGGLGDELASDYFKKNG